MTAIDSLIAEETKRDKGPLWLPRPEEIRAGCARAREGWTEREFERRSVGRRDEWTVPECRVGMEE